MHICDKTLRWNVSLLIQLSHFMRERDRGRVLDESVISFDSSDNESSEKTVGTSGFSDE